MSSSSSMLDIYTPTACLHLSLQQHTSQYCAKLCDYCRAYSELTHCAFTPTLTHYNTAALQQSVKLWSPVQRTCTTHPIGAGMSAAPEEKVGVARFEELSEKRSDEPALSTAEDSSETVLRSEEQELLYDFGQVQCTVVYNVDCAGGVAAWYRVQVPEHWPVSSSAKCYSVADRYYVLILYAYTGKGICCDMLLAQCAYCFVCIYISRCARAVLCWSEQWLVNICLGLQLKCSTCCMVGTIRSSVLTSSASAYAAIFISVCLHSWSDG
eukprot:5550-Heterococcus_DN1.PRE.3